MFYQKPYSIFPTCLIFPLEKIQTHQFNDISVIKLFKNQYGYFKCSELANKILQIEKDLAEQFLSIEYPELNRSRIDIIINRKNMKLKDILIKMNSLVLDDNTVKLYSVSELGKKNIMLEITGIWCQPNSIGLTYKLTVKGLDEVSTCIR